MDTAQFATYREHMQLIIPREPSATVASALSFTMCNLTEKHILNNIALVRLYFTEAAIIKNLK